MEPDFSGYATKANIKCTDGRTIRPEAFQHHDGQTVPLVWQHGHSSPGNVLGHAVLEARPDGIYARGFFNATSEGQKAKELVQHNDINAMSIYANHLTERAKVVFHGMIREVSLVLSGANPGALIDTVTIAHGDGSYDELPDEAIIYTGLELEHAAVVAPSAPATAGPTIQDVYDGLSEEEKNVVHYMIGQALEMANQQTAAHSDESEGDLKHKEGTDNMSRNVFDKTEEDAAVIRHSLSADDVKGILAAAERGGSLKHAVEDYALQHGIESIETLFPDAKNLADRPEFDKRRTEWVAGVLGNTKHAPFSRIKTQWADLTFDTARAKGYIKGHLKKEEFFKVFQRKTGPTTIYKKQALDRDDVLDITDFDIISWIKGEMRLMLEEELAIAILIGDGRDVADEDKVDEDSIRPISTDDNLFATQVYVNIADANSTPQEVVDALLMQRTYYKGTGTPTFYTTELYLTYLLLARDTTGRRLWKTVDELAAELRVSSIVTVEAMEREPGLVGIMVNLQDYTIGADRGGDISMFDQFDIDYNKMKYLLETRVSGALTKIKSALVIRTVVSTAVLTVPTAPTFVTATNTITIPTVTGVTYKVGTGTVTGTVVITEDTTVDAVPSSSSYYFANSRSFWTFKHTA